MRIAILLSAVLALGVSSAVADVPPATAPAPAAALPNAQAAPAVLILRFQQTGDTSNFSWIAPAVQENLLGQVAQSGTFQTISSTRSIAGSDNATALQAAHDSGASIVVFGTYQVIADQIRIDAQVVDVASARTVGTLQAAGAVPDLFKIEDSLSAQLHQLLPTPPPSPDLPAIAYGTPNAPVTPLSEANAAPPPTDNSYSAPQYVAVPPVYSTPVYVYPYYVYGNYCGPTFFYYNSAPHPRIPGRVWHYGTPAPVRIQPAPNFAPTWGTRR